MRKLSFILLVAFLSCKQSSKKDNASQVITINDTTSNSMVVSKKDSPLVSMVDTLNPNVPSDCLDCGIDDVLNMKTDETLLQSFFTEIDSWHNNHEQGVLKNDAVFVPVTKAFFLDFLNHIKKGQLKNDKEFVRNYDFKIAPAAYTDKKECADKMSLVYQDSDMAYSLTVENNFYVQDFGCSEHQIIYRFKIENKKVRILYISIVG